MYKFTKSRRPTLVLGISRHIAIVTRKCCCVALCFDVVLQGTRQKYVADGTIHAVKKEANWTEFITLHTEHNPEQENMMAELRTRKSVDLLLQAQSHFIKATDHDVGINGEHFSSDCIFLTQCFNC